MAGGLGYAPVAPGTFGSVLGVLLFLAAAWVAGQLGVGPLAPVLTAATQSGASAVATLATVVTDGSQRGLVSGIVVGASYLAVVLLMLRVGVWASRMSERTFGRKDDGRIVIDEVVGQLIALMPLLFLSGFAGASPTASGEVPAHQGLAANSFSFFFWVVTGFVLFRLFDISKPGAVRWAERRFEGGLGVMMDDVFAGIYAAITLVLLHLGLRMTGIAAIAAIDGLAGFEIAGLESVGFESGSGPAWLGGRLGGQW